MHVGKLRTAAWISILTSLSLAACVEGLFTSDTKCLEDAAPRGPTCGLEVEDAITRLWSSFESDLALVHRNPMGEKIGEVVEVEGRTLGLDFGGDDVRTFTWLTELPFPIAVGQEVVAKTTESATTLTFPNGSLWVHAMVAFAGPYPEVFEVGPLRITHERGCRSSLGRTVDPVVEDSDGKAARVLPGQVVEADGWTFRNHGATSSPGETSCSMVLEGRYLGIWTAEAVAAGADYIE